LRESFIRLILMPPVVALAFGPEDFPQSGRQNLATEDELQIRRFRPGKIEALFPGSSG
jgi:hypothetical protein